MDTQVEPAYDTEYEVRRNVYLKEICIVFCALQNARHHAVAHEFPDWRRFIRRDSAGHAICIAWPQAPDCFRRAFCNMRILAARKMGALSAGVAISAMGCRARRA